MKLSPKKLLIIDDENNMRHMLATMLRKTDYLIDTAADGTEGLNKINLKLYDVILCDLKMPKMGGIDFLKAAGEKLAGTTVIIMSAYGTIDNAVEAMKLGAYDYISKPFKSDELFLALKKAEERDSLKKENLNLKEQINAINENYNFANMVAKSKKMLAVFQLASKVAQYSTTVLITGESGTGKELVAKGIHFKSPRSKMPFIPLNCGGIPENLLESELFGFTKGAFTGADRNKKGLFEEADKGTIFLDEIGELTPALQVKLLRVLQENEIRPIGSTKTKQIDVRVIAATAKDLEMEIRNNSFREDLFYRLNVLPIKLPPLRNRTKDIPLLCIHFLQKFIKKLNKEIHDISPGAIAMLLKHQWPGNVRELENVMERAVVLAEKKIILPENLPFELGSKSGSARMDDFFEGFSLKQAQRVIEKRLITRALESTGGNRTKAVQLLEISHPSLLSKMKTYKIDIDRNGKQN
ncbi:sigma-54 dependent transcriptional regulator [Desulfococcaceae bacterium HSG9]|nr:sigma-54 dependent transcriptional regulator [Desulfococcaceae bacterium HSG9]